MEANKDNELKKNLFKNIKNKYILQQIFDILEEKKLLGIINYNKSMQKRLDKDINDYIKYYKQVIIELILLMQMIKILL